MEDKKTTVTKPSGSDIAVRDHFINQPTKDKHYKVKIIKGKTKFSDIPERFHATVIAEKLF